MSEKIRIRKMTSANVVSGATLGAMALITVIGFFLLDSKGVNFLDAFLKDGGAEKIDYVHGEDVVERLALQPGNAGFYLAGMQKSELFKTVILDGALPRKTFSMGEAREKRFYLDARKIS